MAPRVRRAGSGRRSGSLGRKTGGSARKGSVGRKRISRSFGGRKKR